MGFFDFLTKKEPEKIKFDELGAWLDKQVEGKNLGAKISKSKEEINKLISDARVRLDELEQAKLVNDKIPMQEKHIMEGHRKSYIQRVRRFLDEINVPDDFSQVGHYNAKFSEALGKLGEDTLRNYAILKQFFDIEATAAAQSIKSIESAMSRLHQDIEKEGIELIKEAKIRLAQYHEDLGKRTRMEQELVRYENELQALVQKKDKINLKMAALKKSPEYEEFKGAIEEKEKCEDEIAALDQELITLFSELNRPLKKYTHNTPHENFADKYIADPAGALEEDHSLRIHEILNKMLQDLSMLELKDKQLERAQATVEKLTREFLSHKKMVLAQLKEQNQDLAKKINKSVIALNISESESWLKSIDRKEKEWEGEVARLKHDIEQLNIDYLKQKAKEKAHEVKKDLVIED